MAASELHIQRLSEAFNALGHVRRLTAHDAAFRTWERRAQTALDEVFGKDHPYARDFRHLVYWQARVTMAHDEDDGQDWLPMDQQQFDRDISRAESILGDALEEATYSSGRRVNNAPAAKARSGAREAQVFIVHGHEKAALSETARFLEKLGLHAVILHEQPNRGRTLIEKLVGHADVDFAVVLLTGDDRGGTKFQTLPGSQQRRARQNVVLELGYFLGRLGRERVCALYEEGVELPSDYSGVLFIPLDARGAWKSELAKELRAAGFDVDLNQAF